MTGILNNGIHQITEFAAFFVPRPAVPRTMTISMQQYLCDDNPVITCFRRDLKKMDLTEKLMPKSSTARSDQNLVYLTISKLIGDLGRRIRPYRCPGGSGPAGGHR
jgi:hypothetical protein